MIIVYISSVDFLANMVYNISEKEGLMYADVRTA